MALIAASLIASGTSKSGCPIERLQGSLSLAARSKTRMKSKVARLQKDLEAAIAREDFEKAAKLRDQIKKCRDEGAQDEGGKK